MYIHRNIDLSLLRHSAIKTSLIVYFFLLIYKSAMGRFIWRGGEGGGGQALASFKDNCHHYTSISLELLLWMSFFPTNWILSMRMERRGIKRNSLSLWKYFFVQSVKRGSFLYHLWMDRRKKKRRETWVKFLRKK